MGILWYVVGMTFGITYSLSYVNPLDWVCSSALKKLIRTVLGLAIAFGIYCVFDLIGDQSTDMGT